MAALKDHFLLEPSLTYLNHGACGACPKEVFSSYQEHQLKFEQMGSRFMDYEFPALFHKSRSALAEFVSCSDSCLSLIPNVTHGVTALIRSLKEQKNAEILLTSQRYKAFEKIWDEAAKLGYEPKECQITFPKSSSEELLEEFCSKISNKTKVIFLSHIASPSGLIFPIKEVCKFARERGVTTIIDGAHAPGMIDVNIQDIDPDYYIGNCHKWMSSAKGCAFLYAREELRQEVQPLVVSYGSDFPGSSGVKFVDDFFWSGVKDYAAFLCLPTLFKFYKEHSWGKQQKRCRKLAVECHRELTSMFPKGSIYSIDSPLYAQMFAHDIPNCNLLELKEQLFNKHKIVVGGFSLDGKNLLRPSFAPYNDAEDTYKLLNALKYFCSG